MNFYKHHIGDYAQATAHLSFVEDAAYSRMIRKYYAEEAPLPADVRAVQRLIGARTREERDAVQVVLEEFFELREDGWHNKRCDEEIGLALQAEPAREAKRESDRERQRRSRERRRELFEALRSLGIVPPFDATTAEMSRLLSQATSQETSRDVTQPVTRDDTINQTPDTRHQTPDTKEEFISHPSGARPLAQPPDLLGDPESMQPTVPCPYGAIVDAYHAELPSLPKVRLRDGKTWVARQKAMRGFWGWVLSSRKSDDTRRAETAEQALQWIKAYFARARDNDFLMGRTRRSDEHAGWRCDFDFLLSEAGKKHVIEKTQERAA